MDKSPGIAKPARARKFYSIIDNSNNMTQRPALDILIPKAGELRWRWACTCPGLRVNSGRFDGFIALLSAIQRVTSQEESVPRLLKGGSRKY